MSQRRFNDPHGRAWDVWDVQPENFGGSSYARGEEQRGAPHKSPVGVDLAGGWLCFQHKDERRRFFPIPPKWSELPDGVLRVMLDVADPVDPASASGATTDPSGNLNRSAHGAADVEEDDGTT